MATLKLAALMGGIFAGGVLVWLFHPKLGPKRRRWLRRRLGLAKQNQGGRRAQRLAATEATSVVVAASEAPVAASEAPAAAEPRAPAEDDAAAPIAINVEPDPRPVLG